MSERFVIELDYPVHGEPRYGWGRPAHPRLEALFDGGRERYARLLDGMLDQREALLRIDRRRDPSRAAPGWINATFPGLDGVSLYGLIAHYRPRRYFEVGMGNSTLFARRAIDDLGLDCEVVVIDPYADNLGASVASRVIREPLESLDPAFFDALEEGDLLFVDNSHRVFMNSDVTVFFLDILPRLKSGVVVGIHDIALPWDYPPGWAPRYYSEQYLLAAYLLAGGSLFEVLLPNAYISLDAELSSRLDPLWRDPAMNGERRPDPLAAAAGGEVEGELIQVHGSAFWLRMN